MTFQLLISTMHKSKQEVFKMLEKMNIHCNCVVVNQCDIEDEINEKVSTQTIKIIFTKERGLSRSRNMALRKATADIVAIADDDLYYYDNFDQIILSYYEKNKKADVVLFGIDSYNHKSPTIEQKCKFLKLGTYISVQTSLKRKVILENEIAYNEVFGTGSGIFNSGEENVFLADCYKNKLQMYYCPNRILKHEKSESTWFKGFNDPKFVYDRGGIYYAISRTLSPLYYLRFLITKRKIIKPITILQAIVLLNEGKKRYKIIQKQYK